MNFEAVIELKARAFEFLYGPKLDLKNTPRPSPFGGRRRERRSSIEIRPMIALGIAAGMRHGDYKLAIRIQEKSTEVYSKVEHIRQMASQEVDTRYIGIPKKLQANSYVHNTQQMWNRPLRIGDSVGHVNITAGSIGAFPILKSTGKHVLLSNNHVLADEDRGNEGDPIIQPGSRDHGTVANDQIGVLKKAIKLDPFGPNAVDAAIATINPSISIEPYDWAGKVLIGTRPISSLQLGEPLYKLGRTTDLTSGTASAVPLQKVLIEYDMGELLFESQLEIEGPHQKPFSLGGDSGALIVDAHCRAVGLLFAGSDCPGVNGTYVSYASDLEEIFSLCDLSFF